MKINGIMLGFAILLTGLLIINLNLYLNDSTIGTLIIIGIMTGCWYFAFDEEENLK